jgi:hypothetical protein
VCSPLYVGYKYLVSAFVNRTRPWLQVLNTGILGDWTCDGQFFICLDHNVTIGQKVKRKFAWSVVNAATKEIVAQFYVNSTAMTYWLQKPVQVASFPFLSGKIKVVYIDNYSEEVAAAIKNVMGAAYMLQDIWHVINGIASTMSSSLPPAFQQFMKELSDCFFEVDAESLCCIKSRLLTRQLADKSGCSLHIGKQKGRQPGSPIGFRMAKRVQDGQEGSRLPMGFRTTYRFRTAKGVPRDHNCDSLLQPNSSQRCRMAHAAGWEDWSQQHIAGSARHQ